MYQHSYDNIHQRV